MNRTDLVMGTLRERATITLVGGLAGCYAAVMLMGSAILDTMSRALHGGSVGAFLGLTSSVFIGIALYVAAVVIAGCVATVIAGRQQQIATLRLLGADARGLRGDIARGAAISATLGAVIGGALGTVGADAARVVLVARDSLPQANYPVATWQLLPAVVAIALTATVAGRIGSAQVTRVSPASAMTQAATPVARPASRLRAAFAVLGLIGGAGLMALSAYLGEEGSSAGFMCAFLGCATFGTAVLVGAPFIVPRLVAAFGITMGGSVPSRVARRNAVADPMRTTRSTLGLIVGVALVTTFAAGTQALKDSLPRWGIEPAQLPSYRRVLDMASTIMICIVVVSAVIAAVGFVSTMSLVVVQRRREIGLLRSLGLTAAQIRSMVTRESLALGLTAVLFGLALGILFGSVGAQALVGSMTPGFVIGLPAPACLVIVAGALALVLAASLPPSRRATAVSPVVALRVEA